MLQKMKKRINIPVLFLALCALLSIVFTFYATKNCIDSDASSELVLSNHLAENGGIMSEDWGYSTELRVVNTQLVYTPLFKIFSDWHMVRFVGALILQAILVGAFYVFTKCVGISKKIFCISAGLILLPVSVCYGRIVLYNSYYVPHIAISLVIVGLTFAQQGKSRFWLIFRTVCLLVVSFLGGLGGIRHGMMTHAPILLAVFIYYMLDDFVCKNKDTEREKKRLIYLLNALASAMLFFIGYLINTKILAEKYVFSDYSQNTIGLIDVSQFKDITYGFMHHFGFRDGIRLISPLGILSVLGFVLAIGCVVLAIVQTAKYKKHQDVSKALPSVFFLSYLAVMLMVFIVLGKYYYFVLYFTPVVVWFIPVFVQAFCQSPKNVSIINMRRILPMAVAGVILLNGLVNGVYFLDHTKFAQKYEGLVFKDREITKTLAPVVDFLVENGYDRGYAEFWNGNIITEMSDGAVRIVNVHYFADTGHIQYNPWLCLNANRELEGTKDFLLLDSADRYSFEINNNLTRCALVYQDETYIVYEIK